MGCATVEENITDSSNEFEMFVDETSTHEEDSFPLTLHDIYFFNNLEYETFQKEIEFDFEQEISLSKNEGKSFEKLDKKTLKKDIKKDYGYFFNSIFENFKNIFKVNIKNLARLKLFSSIIDYAIQSKNGNIIYYENAKKEYFFNLIQNLKSYNHIGLNDYEAYQLIMAYNAVSNIPGDIAEVGVYKGGSALLICELKGDRSLHLFDTFEGLPEIKKEDKGFFNKGEYKSSFEEVKQKFENKPNVFIYKGIFPDTSKPIEDKHFSFVHLDVDIYESTLNCLKFFYPRMNKGGIILTHDYALDNGVVKAFNEFFYNKPETTIQLLGSQCMTVKM